MIEQILYNQIPVKSVPKAIKWYTQVLGLKFIWNSEEERLAQVNLPSGQMLFLFETDDQIKLGFTQNGNKHGITGFHTNDIEKFYKHLISHNVKVTEIKNDGENLFMDFFDPDGNMFNVQCDGPVEDKTNGESKLSDQFNIIKEKEFQAVGLKWEGTFAEAGAGQIRAVHQKFQERFKEIPYIVDPEVMLGLSYHAVPDGEGFTHYVAVKVDRIEKIPAGMISITVPTLTYATYHHQKHQVIEQSYNNIYDWISSSGYKVNEDVGLTHFEKYPMNQNSFAEEFEFKIMIPVLEN